MLLKQIIDENFGDYRECSMLLVTPNCTFKCSECHNKHLTKMETKNFPDKEILKRFFDNPLTSAIVIGGLEPLDRIQDVVWFMYYLNEYVHKNNVEKPTVVIYTGYDLEYIDNNLYWTGLGCQLVKYNKCIIKYGGFQPEYYDDGNLKKVWNNDLGVYLASPNQGTLVFGDFLNKIVEEDKEELEEISEYDEKDQEIFYHG